MPARDHRSKAKQNFAVSLFLIFEEPMLMMMSHAWTLSHAWTSDHVRGVNRAIPACENRYARGPCL